MSKETKELVIFSLTQLVIIGLVAYNLFIVQEKVESMDKAMKQSIIAIKGDYKDYIQWRMSYLTKEELSRLKIDGYYSHDGFYCVMTEGNYNITSTDYHEACHALVAGDVDCGYNDCYEHFCGDD